MVSDGRAGHTSQVKAIAQALLATERWTGLRHVDASAQLTDPILLTPKAPWTWWPGADWPAPLQALPKRQRHKFARPWPSVWIGAGRRVAPYSAKMKDWSGGRTFVVHLMDAGIDEDRLDLRVIPEHDQPGGKNLVSSVGAPAYFSPGDVEHARQSFADLASDPRKTAVVLLGGGSKSHRFQPDDADRLLGQLETLIGQDWQVLITASRRTPAAISARFRQWAERNDGRFWGGPSDGPNPYLGWLAHADFAIVTEDSASMLAEAAWFGLPIAISRLTGGSTKFDRLHRTFIAHGAARWLEDWAGELWTYSRLREAERIADAIINKLIERHQAPE